MAAFKAIMISKSDGGTASALIDFDEGDLMPGDVDVAVEYSTVNYNDGLAVTGKAPVVRRFPMVAGIDFSDTVEVAVFEPPTGIAGLDDIAVVGQPIEHGGCHLGVAEHGRMHQSLDGWCLTSRSQTRIISCFVVGFRF
jgi:hypothetical protein